MLVIYCHNGYKRHLTTDEFVLFYVRLPCVMKSTQTAVKVGPIHTIPSTLDMVGSKDYITQSDHVSARLMHT